MNSGRPAGSTPHGLAQWEAYIGTLHTREIDLGLDRVREVASRMDLLTPACPVISVAGTNGKGSTVACLEAMLRAAGYRTGAYTSPHLVTYNERVRVNGVPASDGVLCEAFAAVEAGRGITPLTYFEFGTLVAWQCFRQAQVQVMVLEVGMGGRLDAVNVLDADVAVVTAIGIDHTRWLGEGREAIGGEKAGIFRPRGRAVCSDVAPPAVIARTARALDTRLWQLGEDFHVRERGGLWDYRGPGLALEALPTPLSGGAAQLRNAAGAVSALIALRDRLAVPPAALREGLRRVRLPGRFQRVPGPPPCVLDVAHNPAAARVLRAQLAAWSWAGGTVAVYGSLKDKAYGAVIQEMAPLIDHWCLVSLPLPGGVPATALGAVLPGGAAASEHVDVRSAWQAACRRAPESDRIVVFGSFLLVGAILAGPITHGCFPGDRGI